MNKIHDKDYTWSIYNLEDLLSIPAARNGTNPLLAY